ncbi:MAG: TIGR03086 family metal-binding protein [Actinomycetota bacterium]
MDTRIETLDTMLQTMAGQLAALDPADGSRPTPCAEMTVEDLGEHLATWIQVFAGAANDTTIDFDPTDHRVGEDRAAVFAKAAAHTVDGLRRNGVDRMMTMTADPLPGELVINMLLMEYVGHGWDLARATATPVPYDEAQAEAALAAAQAIIQPEYRGPELFDTEVDPGPAASAMDRFVGFIGRDPAWAPAG